MSQFLSLARMVSKVMPGMKTEMSAMESRLAAKRIEGIAGGGTAKVTLDGTGSCVKVEIDPAILSKRNLVEDLMRTAVNDAFGKLATETDKEREAMMGNLAQQFSGLDFLNNSGGKGAGGFPGFPGWGSGSGSGGKLS